MRIFNQPWNGRMEDELNALLLQNPRFDRICIAAAFVKRSGASLLRPALDTFVQSGGVFEVVAGIDHRGTSQQGLEELLNAGADVFIFRDNRQDHTFHTKLYLFERSKAEAVVYVGSSNLTAGGLYSNYETNVRYNLDLTVPGDLVRYQEFYQVYETARLHALPLTSALMTDMAQRGWLGNEDTEFAIVPNAGAGTDVSASPSPFPRIPIPISRRRPRSAVKTPLRHVPASAIPISAVGASAPITGPPVSAFLMTLQNTDITRGDDHQTFGFHWKPAINILNSGSGLGATTAFSAKVESTTSAIFASASMRLEKFSLRMYGSTTITKKASFGSTQTRSERRQPSATCCKSTV